MRIPLFPLGLVLLPRMPLPLHIFEDRYRLMIAHCIRTETEFGVVLHSGAVMQAVGCTAGVESVINTYEDGRLDILAMGAQRFRIQALHESKPYLEADIAPIEDMRADPKQTAAAAQQAKETLRQFAGQAGYKIDEQLIAELTHEELSFLLATTDVFSTAERQHFIEMRSTEQRLRTAARALEESLDRMKVTNQVKSILGTETDINSLFN